MKKTVCVVREYPVPLTPEENVRQNLCAELLNYVPKESLLVEIPISAYVPVAGRADVVINDSENKPLIVIELKEPKVMLGDHVKEQVTNYNKYIKAPYVAIHNGNETILYEHENGRYFEISHKNIIDLIGNQPYERVQYLPFKRLSIEETSYQPYIDYLVNVGHVSEFAELEVQQFLSELHNVLLASRFGKFENSIVLEDRKAGYYSFGNASGGIYDGFHRSFIVQHSKKEEYFYRIGMFATAKTVNDPLYGNRTGTTSLCVGIQKGHSESYILQLNLHQFLEKLGNTWILTHNGRSGSMTNQFVIDKVKKEAPHLVVENQIVLAAFPAQESISVEQFSNFITNLIEYSRIRDIARTEYKKKK
ncbi:type I restriction and modification enzyme subunit R-like protein [Ureibacillus xyleni]|uniref:Type I restriction and modification enzyme subunit R-like protein n=1 Tax=Ureibacillus xyleni TaxID=614648 RepID=A0A285T7Y1_9BACL|nr:type I restriction enzyme HsdR N-terminal domain-containing protein [Ureibacillus xyleni]SOC15633.1 type I restriction and modification enzyme subunit R-like protein [Ureibacillus xyleni]